MLNSWVGRQEKMKARQIWRDVGWAQVVGRRGLRDTH